MKRRAARARFFDAVFYCNEELPEAAGVQYAPVAHAEFAERHRRDIFLRHAVVRDAIEVVSRVFVRVAKCERVRIEGGKIQGRSCAEPLRSEELVTGATGNSVGDPLDQIFGRAETIASEDNFRFSQYIQSIIRSIAKVIKRIGHRINREGGDYER